MKRLVDLTLATLALLVLSPLMMSIAVAIRLESPGGVLFRQQRRGRDGQRFVILKFRSMHAQPSEDFRQASRDDRRVTRVGRVIRRFSLDELPQLFNVIEGSMSMVGPRPHPPELDAEFRHVVPMLESRYAVKPGITGWAQINGSRGGTPRSADMRRRVELDLHYIDHRDLGLDLGILARTAWCGWTDEHAY